MLKPLLEKGDSDKRDMNELLTFLSSLERTLGAHASSEKAAGLKAVYLARKYMSDKGALVKPLMEQVALLLPKMG